MENVIRLTKEEMISLFGVSPDPTLKVDDVIFTDDTLTVIYSKTWSIDDVKNAYKAQGAELISIKLIDDKFELIISRRTNVSNYSKKKLEKFKKGDDPSNLGYS
jgi:hypothetical protein